MDSGVASQLGGPFPSHAVSPVRGPLGVSLPTNNPGGRYVATLWAMDSSLWMYGGRTSTNFGLDDLWNFSLTSFQWAQVRPNGTGTIFPSSIGVYGVQYSPGQVFGARGTSNGTHLLLIGGTSSISVWAFDMLQLVWGWISGSSVSTPTDGNPLYATGICFAPSGTKGDTWFFGGTINLVYGNELWFFNASSLSFTCLGGEVLANRGNVYSGLNPWPGSRGECALAAPVDGLVLAGGYGFWNDTSLPESLNDVWVFQYSTGKWLFINGNAGIEPYNNFFDASGALVFPVSLAGAGAAAYGAEALFFAGWYSNAVLSFALSGWNTCPPGTYFTNTSGCADCPEGYSSYVSSTSCAIVCPIGTYSMGGSTCLPCPTGTYSSQSGSFVCQSCVPGSYNSHLGTSACFSCPSGTYSFPEGRSVCSNCSAGTFAPANSSGCIECVSGTYSTPGSAQCTSCNNGTYATAGQSFCSPCVAGQYSDRGESRCWDCAPGRVSLAQYATCVECAPGTFANNPGLSMCIDCQVGRFSNSSASALCEDCPIGTYAESTAQSTCSSCNGTTFVTATTLASQCVCPTGFYGRLASDETCRPCPSNAPGVSCPINSSLPHIAPGYARASPLTDPSLTFLCIPAVACECTGYDSYSTTCATGYQGTNCSACTAGYYRNGYVCVLCPTSQGILVFAIGVVVCLLVLVAIVLCFWKKKARVTPEVKIAAFGLQFLGTFSFISSSWPVSLTNLFNVLSVTNLDLNVVAPECAVPITFFDKTVAGLLFPVLVWVFGTALVCALVASKSHERFVVVVRDRAGPLAVMTLMGFYTVIVKVLAEPLQCTQQPDGRYAMTASPDIACYESQWNDFLPWLVLFWLLYVLAAPTGLFFLFRRLRGDLAMQSKYNMLVSDYRGQFYWWGLVVVLRKTALVSSSTILSGSLRYFVTFTLILAFHFLEVGMLPFKTHRTLQVSLLWSAIPMVMLTALTIVFESSSVSPVMQDVLAVVLLVFVIASTLLALSTKHRLLTCGLERIYLDIDPSGLKAAEGECEGTFRIKRPTSTVRGITIMIDCTRNRETIWRNGSAAVTPIALGRATEAF